MAEPGRRADRLHVLLVDPGGGRGGGERVVEELAKSCAGTRFHPIVVSLAAGSWAEELSRAGIEAYVVPRHAYGRTTREIRVVLRLIRLARARKAGLVHASLNSSLLYASLAAKACRLPLVWHIHDVLPAGSGSAKALVTVLRRLRPDFIVFGNDSCIEGWRTILPPGSMPSHTIIWPGVDPPDLSTADPARARQALGLRPEGPLIGMFARYAPNKGHEDLVRAAQLVHRRVPSAQVVICTVVDLPAPALQHLTQLRARLGLDDCVVFAGGVSEETRTDLLASLTVLAHPATTEPFGLAMLEAMAAGKPVVAAASQGARFLLDDGKVGTLVPPADPDALGRALVDLLADPGRQHEMGAASRQRSLLLTTDATAHAVFRVWSDLLAARPRRPGRHRPFTLEGARLDSLHREAPR